MPRNTSGLCATCLDEDAERAGEAALAPSPDHTPALLALIEERDRLRAKLGITEALRAATADVLMDAGPPDHQAELLRVHREKCDWMNRALEAEAERDRLKVERDEGPKGKSWAQFAKEQADRALAAEAKGDALREALARAQSWHESEDKALSKSGRSDADYHWRRLQHREQLEAIRGTLPEAEYDAAWGRINARYEQETADVRE